MIRTFVRSTVSVLAISAVLSGCSVFHHKDNYYSKAEEARPLEVPPDLDAVPAANELNVPAAGSSASASATSSSSISAPPASAVGASSAATLTGAGLHVADSVDHTWERVGIALDRAQLGTISERDASGHSFTLEVNGLRAPATPAEPEQEHHWYTRILHPFGGGKSDSANGQPVSGRLTVKVIADGDGSRVDVEGAANDSSSSEAARRVLNALRERLS